MPAYAIAATCVVAVSSVIVFLVFYRMKVLNIRTLISVTLASLITALGLPVLFRLVSSGMDAGFDSASPSVTLLITVAAYLLIVVILSVVISFIINGAGTKKERQDASENGDPDKASAEADNYLEQIFVNFIGGHEQSGAGSDNIPADAFGEILAAEMTAEDASAETTSAEDASAETASAETARAKEDTAVDLSEEITPEGNTSPEISAEMQAEDAAAGMPEMAMDDSVTAPEPPTEADNTIIPADDGILANIDENAAVMENNLEISVDSNENIDKMGIENIVHNRNSLTIEDCINEAFRLKGAGDFESAILYHMYALDKKPDKELTFWIILDICVMYKSLGQQELALDILNSYYETYGDTMDISVKEEIRKNLTAV